MSRLRLLRPSLLLLVGLGAAGGALIATSVGSGPLDVPPLYDGEAVATAASMASVAPRASTPSQSAAAAMLRRAAGAARAQPYSGTQFVSSWTPRGQVSAVVQVAHVPGQGSLVRVQPTEEGQATQVYQSDDSPPGSPGDLSALDAQVLGVLQSNYQLVLAGSATCSGRPAKVVEVRRRDATGSVAGRFWIDTQTGLLLRRQVIDAAGRLIKASAFVDVDESHPPTLPADLPPAIHTPAGRALHAADFAGLRAKGWLLPGSLPGGLRLFDGRLERDGSAKQPTVLHLSYSDGLSTVSVFEQRGNLDIDSLSGWQAARVGQSVVYAADTVPLRVAWSSTRNDHATSYTVIADATPESTVAAIGALPHDPVANSAWKRLDRSLDRLGAWLNPFD